MLKSGLETCVILGHNNNFGPIDKVERHFGQWSMLIERQQFSIIFGTFWCILATNQRLSSFRFREQEVS